MQQRPGQLATATSIDAYGDGDTAPRAAREKRRVPERRRRRERLGTNDRRVAGTTPAKREALESFKLLIGTAQDSDYSQKPNERVSSSACLYVYPRPLSFFFLVC